MEDRGRPSLAPEEEERCPGSQVIVEPSAEIGIDNVATYDSTSQLPNTALPHLQNQTILGPGDRSHVDTTYNPALQSAPSNMNPMPTMDRTTAYAVPIAYAVPVVEEVVVPIQQEVLEYPYGPPMRHMEATIVVPFNELSNEMRGPPIGAWRDDICDCLSNIAPTCLLSIFCPCVLAGQVASKSRWRCTYTTIVTMYGGALVLCNILVFVQPSMLGIARLIYLAIAFTIGFQLRIYMRERFRIPGSVYADCCLSFWCPCLNLAQMRRHLERFDKICSSCDIGPGRPVV